MDWIKIRVLVIGIGFLLDCLIGDPVWLYHPVRIMGKMISFLEEKLRKLILPKQAGFVMVLCMLVIFGLLPAIVLAFFYHFSMIGGIILETVWCYQMIAARDLVVESHKVYQAIVAGNVELARKNVSIIVGRDTEKLDQEGIIRAAVETVAENTSDGVIAPLFYMMIGGGALGVCYKAINTMDSMVGYHNERYEEFGFFAAKLDDAANYLPARLAAILMIFAAFLCGLDAKGAFRIFRRDRYQHKSPNSAQTESVCAGALGVQLAGDAWYFGKLHKKPFIGDPLRKVEPQDILRGEKLMYGTTVLMLAAIAVIGVLL